MTKKLLLFFFVILLGVVGCNKKKKEEPKTQVKREVVKPPVVKKDTIIPTKPIPEPIIEKPDNKYFLIAGSFSSENNANNFKNELIEQGFDSEVIIRNTGKNQEFYKVSYKGFSDKEIALKELAFEKKQPNNEDVWLLVKK